VLATHRGWVGWGCSCFATQQLPTSALPRLFGERGCRHLEMVREVLLSPPPRLSSLETPVANDSSVSLTHVGLLLAPQAICVRARASNQPHAKGLQ
jgi:hypothetical protein